MSTLEEGRLSPPRTEDVMSLRQISIIVPIHNDAAVLPSTLASLKKALGTTGKDYEILLAEDGSTDESQAVAERLRMDDTILLHSPIRLGKGAAISAAIRAASAPVVVFTDADVSADLSVLPVLIREIENGADISVGSRLLADSGVVGRSTIRELSSRGYNLMVRLLFRTAIHDHQCGLKAFRKSSILPLLTEVKATSWFWDTELLIRAQAKALKVSEIPIHWVERGSTHIRFHRDVPVLALSLLMLRFRLSTDGLLAH